MDDTPFHRELRVPANAAGMRLDRFLALRFRDRSRSELKKGIVAGEVTDETGRPLRASWTVKADELLHIRIPGIAPVGPPPPFPAVLYEDDRVVALDKPPGLMAHPSGTRFVYALVGLARDRWPDDDVDLVHRLDKDTSGVILLTKDMAANAFLKRWMNGGGCRKEYVAVARGNPAWDERVIEAPIGYANGPIRIQMGVVPDGLPARTDVTVLERRPDDDLVLVRCRLHTGRTHQIRVHLEHVGLPILGDVMYGVPPEVFLDTLEHGITDATLLATGAPRHALHAARLVFPHPDGGEVEVEAPLPADMASWWADPGVLPGRAPTAT
jgi:23S rRNA pseudouridine1911/1915/1917 synthase